MMRSIRRFLRIYQGFVVSGAILLFGAVALLFAVIPGIGATRDLYDRFRQTEADIAALSTKRAFLESLNEDELRDRVMMLLSAVPQDKSVPTIFSSVEGLAVQSGMTILDMSLMSPGSLATGAGSRPSAAEKKIGASTLPFSLTASGTYDQIRAFVSSVNAVKRLFDVTSFELSIASGGLTQAKVSLTAFYLPLPARVGSIESPVAALSQKEEQVLGEVMQYPDVSASSGEALTPVVSEGRRDPFAR